MGEKIQSGRRTLIVLVTWTTLFVLGQDTLEQETSRNHVAASLETAFFETFCIFKNPT